MIYKLARSCLCANHHFKDTIIYGDKENKICMDKQYFCSAWSAYGSKRATEPTEQLTVIKNGSSCSSIPPSALPC